MITAKKRKPQKPRKALNSVMEWQRQMLRLYNRYGEKIRDEQNGILPFSWNISYVELLKPGELQYQEFVCYTNNAVFAAMIFEAHMLSEQGQHVTISEISFNDLIK